MTDLTPKSWLALLKEFLTNYKLFVKYYRLVVSTSNVSLIKLMSSLL